MQHSTSSRITIGGGRFTHLEQKKVTKLVDLAFELGIRRIDTAPSYPESEKKIGQAIKGYKDFQITTKVRPAPGVTLNADAIKKSVQKSLIDLGLDEVECIYLHSVSPQHCDDSVFSSLVELKQVFEPLHLLITKLCKNSLCHSYLLFDKKHGLCNIGCLIRLDNNPDMKNFNTKEYSEFKVIKYRDIENFIKENKFVPVSEVLFGLVKGDIYN
jgi:hypothetical protein